MFRYRSHGLWVESDVALPELRASSGLTADVTIRRGRVSHLADQAPLEGPHVLGPRRYLFGNALGGLLIEEGKRIVVEPGEGIAPEVVRMLIYGLGFSVLLHQRNQLALHASGVARSGSAVLFCGNSDAGKSTLAAELYAEGAALVCEDLAPLVIGARRVEVAPGFPRLKLRADDALRIGVATRALPRLYVHAETRFYPAERGFSLAPAPVARIYTLERGDRPALTALPPSQACAALMEHSRAAELFEGRQDHGRWLEACASVVEAVAVKRLCTGDGVEDLARAVALVDEDLADER